MTDQNGGQPVAPQPQIQPSPLPEQWNVAKCRVGATDLVMVVITSPNGQHFSFIPLDMAKQVAAMITQAATGIALAGSGVLQQLPPPPDGGK